MKKEIKFTSTVYTFIIRGKMFDDLGGFYGI
jgi:hypothetical protein